MITYGAASLGAGLPSGQWVKAGTRYFSARIPGITSSLTLMKPFKGTSIVSDEVSVVGNVMAKGDNVRMTSNEKATTNLVGFC